MMNNIPNQQHKELDLIAFYPYVDLLCMVQNIHWYGLAMREELLYIHHGPQGSWLFTRW